MKLIIAGSRDLIVTPEEIQEAIMDLQEIYPDLPEFITELISGAAAGIDTCGEVWARRYRLNVRRFPPDYSPNNDPKQAPLKRNVVMAEYADALIAFPNPEKEWSGTKHMIEQMKMQNKPWISREIEPLPEMGVREVVVTEPLDVEGLQTELDTIAQTNQERHKDFKEKTGINLKNGGSSFGEE